MDFLNYNSVVIDNVDMLPSIENLPGFEACAVFTVNSASVFREDVDIMPTIIDDKLSYVTWGSDNLQLIDQMGDNHMPFDLLALVEFLAPQATSRIATSQTSPTTRRNAPTEQESSSLSFTSPMTRLVSSQTSSLAIAHSPQCL